MKFSLSVLFAALCAVLNVEAVAFSAATITMDLFHETANMDKWSATGTVGLAIAADSGSVTIVLTAPSDLKRTFVAGTVLNTDYEVYCGTTKWSTDAVSSAAVSGSSLILTITTVNHASRVCAVGSVLKVTMLKAAATVGTSAKGSFAMTTTTIENTAASTTTYTDTKRGTFATITASSLTIEEHAGHTGAFSVKFTGSTLVKTTGKFNVYMPGYSLAAGNQCTFTATSGTAPTVAVTGSSADASPWEFTLLTEDMTAQEYTFACNKVSAAAAQAASTCAVIIGETTTTVPVTGLYTLPAVTTSAPTPAFSSAPASAATSAFAFALCAVVALFV